MTPRRLVSRRRLMEQQHCLYNSNHDGGHEDLIEEDTMLPAKQKGPETISQLPGDTDMNEPTYGRYVLDKIRKSQEAVAQGDTVGIDALKHDIDAW